MRARACPLMIRPHFIRVHPLHSACSPPRTTLLLHAFEYRKLVLRAQSGASSLFDNEDSDDDDDDVVQEDDDDDDDDAEEEDDDDDDSDDEVVPPPKKVEAKKSAPPVEEKKRKADDGAASSSSSHSSKKYALHSLVRQECARAVVLNPAHRQAACSHPLAFTPYLTRGCAAVSAHHILHDSCARKAPDQEQRCACPVTHSRSSHVLAAAPNFIRDLASLQAQEREERKEGKEGKEIKEEEARRRQRRRRGQ